VSNADVVRRALALTTDPGADLSDEALAELFAPDVVVDMSARVFNPHVYEGYDGLRQYRVDLGEVWQDVAFEPQELIEEGDGILAITRMTGLGRGSGVPIDALGTVLYRLADGRIEHARFIDPEDHEKALAALREAAAKGRAR
jgi:ketosteroid isomerase-like protein